MKQIYYWGIGTLCRRYVSDENLPDAFIDSSADCATFMGKPVYRPDDIIEWDKLTVVVFVKDNADIISYLEQKQIQSVSLEYVTYQEYLRQEFLSELEFIEFLHLNEEIRISLEGRTFLKIPVFVARNHEAIEDFFMKYGEQHPCFCLMDSRRTSHVRASEILGMPTYNVPIFRKDNEEVALKCAAELPDNDLRWAFKLRAIKDATSDVYFDTDTVEKLWFYRQLFECIKPKNIVIWSAWIKDGYIISHVADEMNIPYVFVEHGFLPNTFQFDRKGIAGHASYAIEDVDWEEIEPLDESAVNYAINGFKSLMESPKDTDEYFLKQIDDKPTVFFVGMGDKDMALNNQSSFWQNYVSSVYSSTADVLKHLLMICEKNEWNLIFKPHPNMDTGIDYAEISYPNFYYTHTMDVNLLIDISDVVVSISSAVEYNALLMKKPVVFVGHSSFEKVRCGYRVNEKNDLEKCLQRAITEEWDEEQGEELKKFLSFLCKTSFWKNTVVNGIPYGLSFDEKDFFEENR